MARGLRHNATVLARSTSRPSHGATLGGAAWLGLAHLAVDAGCVTSVLRALPPSDAIASAAFAFVLGYDLLAFAGQVPCGYLIDRLGWRRGAALAGLALTAAALLVGPALGVVVVVLAGLGNALFHVGAGAMVLAGSGGRAAPAGVFVAPGALGLGLGILLGRHFVAVPAWPILLAVAVAPVAVWVSSKAERADTGAPALRSPLARRRAVVLVLGLLAFSVAIRSLVGTVGADGCPRGLALLVTLPAVAFAGKLAGGFVADRFGFIDVAMVALLASAPLLAFAAGDPWLALPGLLIFQMTMPVTLVAALRALPAWPGLGFGVLCLALVAGTLPAYLPGGWRPSGWPLLLLVLASALALYVALRLLHLPAKAPVRAEPAALPLSSSNPCRGLP